ncbi:hypothetical protein ABS71_05815 [bacterium SCN 62-11]|nr:MAG: hypothetical protein ABS71_05815 [bacterium SCN 62-11]
MKAFPAALLLWVAPLAAQPLPPVEEPLTLRQTVDRALESHLKSKLNLEKIRESEAHLAEAWAGLNPTVNLNANQYNRTINLASQGLGGSSLPIPSLVGPFFTFDARVQVVYKFLDASQRWKIKSAEVGREISRQEYELARHQREQGVAAGIDVTRADARRVEQELKQAQLDDKVRRGNLDLARLIGAPLNTHYRPQESALAALEDGLTVEAANQVAQEHRVELQVARLKEEQLHHEVSAADAEDSPTMNLAADYGFAGNTPTQNIFGTHNVGINLSIPLFDGGVSDAKSDTFRSQLRQAEIEHQDQQLQVEQDVRGSFLKLQLARQQIVTARASLVLAQREMTMSSDRFAAGLGTSVELVDAQAKLARARDAEVQALVAYQLAQVELAANMGRPELVLQGEKP